jgi:hypothetical protein
MINYYATTENRVPKDFLSFFRFFIFKKHASFFPSLPLPRGNHHEFGMHAICTGFHISFI